MYYLKNANHGYLPVKTLSIEIVELNKIKAIIHFAFVILVTLFTIQCELRRYDILVRKFGLGLASIL